MGDSKPDRFESGFRIASGKAITCEFTYVRLHGYDRGWIFALPNPNPTHCHRFNGGDLIPSPHPGYYRSIE
jgi:hypothetical protein